MKRNTNPSGWGGLEDSRNLWFEEPKEECEAPGLGVRAPGF